VPPKVPSEATVGVWRVTAGGDSAVVKVVRQVDAPGSRWPAARAQEHPYYWRREPLVYGSGLLSRLAGGLRAPGCRAIVERPDGSVALWLEDVPAAPPWSVDQLATLAHGAGVTQGCIAADPPDDVWLARGWLREYLRLHDALDPEAETVLARLDALPQTFCHLDLHPANVLGEDASVVIDWAHCGLAALGVDPGVLVADGVADEAIPPALADEAAREVLAAYLAGLSEGGWTGRAEDVRYAFLRGTALRLSWLPRTKPAWAATRDLLDRWRERARELA
jgi:hypothetical protein